MNLESSRSKISQVINYELFHLGNTPITTQTILGIIIVVVVTWTALFFIKKGIYASRRLDKGKKYSINVLIRYIILFIALGWILDILGFKLIGLIASGAGFLVGIGLGLRSIFSDFVSGIVLLIDNAIKVGDVIEVDGLVCQVQEINLRTSLVITRDDRSILLPNSLLTGEKLINWTHTEETARFDVTVRVKHGTPPTVVEEILLEIATSHPEIHKTPPPFVRLSDFVESGMEFVVFFWSNNLFRVENLRSDIRKKIALRFAQEGIAISYPHYVIHHNDTPDSKLTFPS